MAILLVAATGSASWPCGENGVVRLDAREVMAVAERLAGENEATITRLHDRVLRAEADGDGVRARRRAHAEARAQLANVYAWLHAFAGDADTVYEADAQALAPLFAAFSEPGLFPLARLTRVRLGAGAVCVEYDLARPGHGTTVLGDKVLRWSVEDRVIDGGVRRVLVLEWPSTTVGHTRVLLAAHHQFRVARVRSEGPPAPYELIAVHDIRGAWIERWGLHRPEAYMFWATPEDALGPDEEPLVGVRVYIPGMRLELPLLLPDIGLEDLRALALPMPLLRLDYLRSPRAPEWLVEKGGEGLREWKGLGPVPAFVAARFPDR